MFYSSNLKKINQIRHCFFSRKNGNSSGIYKSLNCGVGSKDKKQIVEKNLCIVAKNLNVKREKLVLMNQTHSNKVSILNNENEKIRIDADAILTKKIDLALGVLTADCAPILIYETKKEIIGCIHAGWKGAIGGIIENTIDKVIKMGGDTKSIVAAVGPCISQESYEVKKDFYLEFKENIENSDSFFIRKGNSSFLFDLRAFVTKKLNKNGVLQVDNINLDSFTMTDEYFSHRRAKKLGENDYGRCISVIMKTNTQN